MAARTARNEQPCVRLWVPGRAAETCVSAVGLHQESIGVGLPLLRELLLQLLLLAAQLLLARDFALEPTTPA